LVVAWVSIMLTSCSKTSNGSYGSNPNPQPYTPSSTVKLSTSATLGKILTDSAGLSLYFYSLDANGSSACTGGCLTAWPAFYIASPAVGDGLVATDFATIIRGDGSKQTTYKGWPLYYYQFDAKAGDINGDAVDNTWFVAKPDYTVMLVNNQLVGNDGIQYDSLYAQGQQIVQYLTDDRGVTLYSYSLDKYNTNNYTSADFSNNSYWPIYQSSAISSVPSIIPKSLFNVIMVFGKYQVVFKGWPLFYFGSDSNHRGSTKGASAPQ
jgi:predicted lipoprotein with Yx(FWY)xxD motif